MFLSALTKHETVIEEGKTYLRVCSSSMTEQAQVIEVMEDRLGIPHVRFRLQVIRGSARQAIENRTLALETFSSRYKKV